MDEKAEVCGTCKCMKDSCEKWEHQEVLDERNI